MQEEVKLSEEDKKCAEFVKKVTDLQEEYKEYCILHAANVVTKEWEVFPMIKLKKMYENKDKK